MRISIVVAVATNGVIGRAGELPWRLPADLRRFKALTMGHHLVVGRKTWESIGRPLPGRRMVVVSRRLTAPPTPGVAVVSTFDGALEVAREAGETETFVAGGAALYAEALPQTDRLYLTRVEAEIEGDVRFPPWRPEEWTLVAAEERAADERNPFPLVFQLWTRKTATEAR